jgi:hypothetical protein
VTDVLVHAVESRTPRTRYVCASLFLGSGKLKTPAEVVTWLDWLLPDRLMDALVGASYKRSV